MSRRVARALMAAFSRFVHPEILNFVSTPRMVRVEAAGDGARERVLGHVTRGATGCRRHVKAFQAGHVVIRSSAPGCELSACLAGYLHDLTVSRRRAAQLEFRTIYVLGGSLEQPIIAGPPGNNVRWTRPSSGSGAERSSEGKRNDRNDGRESAPAAIARDDGPSPPRSREESGPRRDARNV